MLNIHHMATVLQSMCLRPSIINKNPIKQYRFNDTKCLLSEVLPFSGGHVPFWSEQSEPAVRFIWTIWVFLNIDRIYQDNFDTINKRICWLRDNPIQSDWYFRKQP